MIRLPDRSLRRLAIAFLLGLASVGAFAPIAAFPLIFATLGGLCFLLARSADEDRPQLRGALLGSAFGLGLFLGGVSWIYVSLSNFGGMPAPVAGVATFLFCAFLSFYPALAGALYCRLARGPQWSRPLLFATLWVLTEWLRGWLLTGFPWLAVGYTQTPPSPLAGFAPVGGVYGVSFVTAWIGASMAAAAAALLYRAAVGTLLPPLLVALALLGAGAGLREVAWTQPTGSPLSVSLLQGNIPQEIKWRPEWFIESLRTYHQLARENPAQLTVLPETAIPAFLDQLPPGLVDELRAFALRENGELLLGIATRHGAGYANSALAVGASGMQRYDKSHLVPFGEFVPPGFRWFMDLARIPMSDFTPGPARQPPLRIGELKVAANICYEDAFGEEIIGALPEAELLVNLSNVAWFGDSLAPAQHLQIAQMRALETGRMMLRATNTGMTAIIGADGKVVAALRPYTRDALRGEVRGYSGLTPFAAAGNTPVVLGCVLAILALVGLGKRKTAS